MSKKPKSTKPGIVQEVILPYVPDVPEKAEISIPSADDLYREIRIENTLTDENGITPPRLTKRFPGPVSARPTP